MSTPIILTQAFIKNVYYHFNISDVSGLKVSNYANIPNTYDATLSKSGLINSANYKYGTSALNLKTQYTSVQGATQTTTISLGGSNKNVTTLGITQEQNRIIYGNGYGLFYYAIRDAITGVWGSFTQTLQTTSIPCYGMKISSDGNRVFIGGANIYYCTWNGTNYSTFTQISDNTAISGTIRGLDVTTDNSRIIGNSDYGIWFSNWNGTSYDEAILANLPGNLDVGCNADGSRIVYNGGSNGYGTVATWNGTNYTNPQTVTNYSVWASKLSPDGNIAFFSSQTSTNPTIYMYYWNGTTYVNTNMTGISSFIIPITTPVGAFFLPLEFTRNGTSVYMTSYMDDNIYAIDISYNYNETTNYASIVPQYLTLPPITTNTYGFSVAGWVASTWSPSNAPIFDLGNGATSNNIILSIVGGYLSVTVYSGSTKYTKTDTTTFINTNQWYHIGLTISNALPSVWTLYLNGNVINTFNSGTIYPTIMTRTSNYIGESNNTATTQPSFTGSINEFYIFSNVLTTSNIQSLYNSQELISPPSTNISPNLIPSNYNALIKTPVTYYYDICGNEIYNSFFPISLLSSICQVPFIGKAGIPYNPEYINTTISTLTLYWPANMVFDSTYNNAYICTRYGMVYKINMYTGLVTVVVGNYTTGNISSVPISSYNSLFNYPISVAFDPSNNFYIADQSIGKIAKMNLQTSMITNIVYTPSPNNPNCILIDSAYNLYYSSTNGIYTLSLLGSLPATTVSNIDTTNIFQMTFPPNNQTLIYGAAQTSPLTIRVCNIQNTALSYSITMPTGINTGYGIDFDTLGNLYVTSTSTIYLISNTVISSISSSTTLTGSQITTFSTGINGVSYSAVRWLSIDNANNLYMTDTVGSVIYKFVNNTYNTNYLLPNGLDLGTAFLPKYMLGGTNSQVGSFPISNYVVDSTNSPIEYYIEGATYNIIDNSGLVCHYMFNSQDINGQVAANYASGIPIYDASMSATGMGYQADYILGNGCLNLVASSSQYVQVTNSTITTTAWPPAGGLTFACWVNPSISGNPQWTRIFEFGVNGSSSDSIVMAFTSTGTIQVCVFNVLSYVYKTIYPININTGTWTHLVWVINPTTYSFYVNGKFYQTLTSTQYPNAIARTYCYIGKSLANNPYYNGQIDDFRIYQRAITATEAFQLYSFNGLSLYYKFDAEDVFKGDGISIANYASGYPLYDASLTAVNTQLNGISTTSSMVGTACLCLSTNYVNIPTPNISTNGFTVAFWMNTTSTNQNYPTLLALNGNGTYNVYIFVSNYGGTNYSIMYECRYNGTTSRTLLSTNISVNDGVWHHIVLTSTYAALGSATSNIRIYIDNVLNNSTTTGYYPNAVGLISGSTIGGGTPVYIGLIDDYRVYNRVLSPMEITALYTYTYTPNKLAVNAIGAATFTVTTPKYPGITAAITTAPVVTHTDSVTNSIYKTVLSGLSQNVGYGYTFTYSNGLVLTGNTTLYSTPAVPTLTVSGNTTTGTTVTTQSYSGVATTAAYFYVNNVVFQGSYISNKYTATITGLSIGNSYPVISNIFNNSSIGQSSGTVYTLPSVPTIAVTTINSNSIVFTFTNTDTIAPSSYSIVINSQTFTSATNTVTATGLLQNTSYSYYGYASNTAGNSANTTTSNVTTIYKATGGDTIYQGSGYRYHIFTSISAAGTFATTSGIPSTTFNIIAVGGGGGGGGGANFASDHSCCGGGGGAGAYYNNSLTVTSLNFSITVGDKGSAGRWQGISGSFAGDTIISGTSSAGPISYTMKGGGAGGGGQNGAANPQFLCPGYKGGSGGGGGTNNGGATSNVYAAGTASNVTGTGYAGGSGIGNKTGSILYYNSGGGGGGALSTGANGIFTNTNPYGGNGGSGVSLTVYNGSTPIIYYLCAGGGGGSSSINVANGGLVGAFMAGGSGEYMSGHTSTASAIRCTAPPANCYGCGGGGAGGATLLVTEGLNAAPGSQGIVIIYYTYP